MYSGTSISGGLYKWGTSISGEIWNVTFISIQTNLVELAFFEEIITGNEGVSGYSPSRAPHL